MKNLFSHDTSDRIAHVIIYTLGICLIIVATHIFLDYINPKPKEQNGPQTTQRNR